MRIAFFPLLLVLVVLAACGTNEAPASSAGDSGSDCHGSKKGRAVTDAEKAPVVRKSDDCDEERRVTTCADRRNRIGNAVKAFQVVAWRNKANRLESRGEAIEERLTARAEELRAGARQKAKEVAKAVAVNRD